jgi:hypothetical protein
MFFYYSRVWKEFRGFWPGLPCLQRLVGAGLQWLQRLVGAGLQFW